MDTNGPGQSSMVQWLRIVCLTSSSSCATWNPGVVGSVGICVTISMHYTQGKRTLLVATSCGCGTLFVNLIVAYVSFFFLHMLEHLFLYICAHFAIAIYNFDSGLPYDMYFV